MSNRKQKEHQIMNRNSITIIAATTLAFTHCALAGDPHSDVILTVEDNAITINSETPEGTTPTRVFGSDLVNIAGFWTTDEPGFDNLPGTFPTGTDIGFVIEDTVRKWDGQGFDDTATEQMSLEFSVLGPVFSPTTPGTEAVGFNIPVQPDGGWHKHYDFFLESPASAGVYLLTLRLTHSGSIEDSLPLFLVFNRSESETVHDAAIDYVISAIAPPSCPEDLNNDNIIDTADLGILIAAFGTADPIADINNDNIVDTADLGILIAQFGNICNE